MNKLISLLITHAKAVFALAFALCMLLGVFAFNIKIEAKSTSFFLADDPDLAAFFRTEEDFGSQDFLIFAKSFKSEIFSEQNIAELKNLREQIEQVSGKNSTFSILNAPLFLSGAPSIDEGANLQKAREEILKNPIYVKNLISKDAKTAGFLISHSDELIIKHLRELSDENSIVGGMSIIVDRMIAYIKSDLATYGIALIVLLAAAVWLFFGSFYYVFCCLLICICSLIASTGLFALCDFAVSVISSNYVALVLIITISVVIHILAHFSELSGKNSDIKLLVRHTLLAKAKPSFYAILTTVVGFLSLVFSGIVPISELGMMMSIGIIASLILCYLFMPFLLLHAPRSMQAKLGARLLAFSAHCAIYHRAKIYLISAFLLIICAFALPRLHAENSFVNYFKDSSEIKKGLVLIDKKLGGTLPLDITLSWDSGDFGVSSSDEFSDFLDEYAQNEYFLTSAKIDEVAKVQEFLENQPHVGSVLSVLNLAEFARLINPNVADTMGLNLLLKLLDERSFAQIVKPYFNEDKKLLRLAVRMKDSDKSLRRAEFLATLEKELPKLTHAKVQISGVMVLYNNMLSSLVRSQVDTLSFVVASIFVLFLIIFRNLRFSLIGIIANIVPLSALFSIIAFAGLRLDLMSITIAAISIGIGVDDIIHYVHRFKEEIKRKNIEDAIKATHASIGSALFYTTTTVVMGFMLMMSSSFMPTIYFGLLTVLIMVLLLCGSLFLLPSLIISWRFGGYFKAEFKD